LKIHLRELLKGLINLKNKGRDMPTLTNTHICISLEKLAEYTLKGTLLLDNDDGTTLTEAQHYQVIADQKAKGYKYFAPCDSRDAEGRCAGHKREVTEEEYKKIFPERL